MDAISIFFQVEGEGVSGAMKGYILFNPGQLHSNLQVSVHNDIEAVDHFNVGFLPFWNCFNVGENKFAGVDG